MIFIVTVACLVGLLIIGNIFYWIINPPQPESSTLFEERTLREELYEAHKSKGNVLTQLAQRQRDEANGLRTSSDGVEARTDEERLRVFKEFCDKRDI